MRTPLIRVLMTASILGCSAQALGQPADAGPPTDAGPPAGDEAYVQCISKRLASVVEAAAFIDERASALAASVGDSVPTVATQIAKLREVTARLHGKASSAPTPATPEAGDRALLAVSIDLSILHSKVSRLKLALINSSKAEPKVILDEMSKALADLRTLIPPDEPARGCRP